MRTLVLGLLCALTAGCGDDGSTDAPSGGPCEQVRACCPSSPLGGTAECMEVAGAGDVTECMFYLEDAMAEGQCLMTMPRDSGTPGTDGATMCTADGQMTADCATCCAGLICVGSGTSNTCRNCAISGSCTSNSGCCSNACVGGTCADCIPVGMSCAGGGTCCMGSCTGDVCTTCKGAGELCESNADCCSGFTCQNSTFGRRCVES